MEQLIQEQWIRVEPWVHQLNQWADQLMEWVQRQPAAQLYATFTVLFLSSILFLLGSIVDGAYLEIQIDGGDHDHLILLTKSGQLTNLFVNCLLDVRVLKRTKSNTIVLAGLSGSGKTVLFYQLRDGSSHRGTVTSMDPNEGSFVLHSESEKKGKIKPVHVVDVPGHSRLRPKLDGFLPQAAGLVFVVDALDFLPNCRAVAEYLYDILTKAAVVKWKIPLLIVCNKTDKVSAHSKDFIRKQLEKEIDKLRVSRTGASEADIADEFTLGVTGEPFAFSQCLNRATVTEASGLTGEISQLEQFIREHVKY